MVRAALLVLLTLTTACGLTSPRPPASASPPQIEILRDTEWRGRVVIDGSVKVFKGATLTILPGTEVVFVRRDDDKDGLGDGALIVEGSLLAVGTPRSPIVFRSAAASPAPGDWLEIRVDFSRETRLRYCEIRDSAHTLHAHFTKAVVEDCHIHHNIDGCRLGQGNFILRRNLIEQNEGKGINFRNSTVDIRHNIIRGNASGIFLFETDRPPVIEQNNFYANGDHLRLGDFFQRDLVVGENWWGARDAAAVAAMIHDHAKDASLGRVTVTLAADWLPDSGPALAAEVIEQAQFTTDGFVDVPPLPVDRDLIVASWDGSVRRVTQQGALLWQMALGDVVDAPLAGDGTRIFGQNWGREIFALDAADGRKLWSVTYAASPADDHRQGGVVVAGAALLVPVWNGTLLALDPATGSELWRAVTPGPLRAPPTVAGERIYLPGGDGVLRCFDRKGTELWRWSGGSPQLAAVALAAGNPVVVDRSGVVTALDPFGQVRWQRPLAEICYYAAPIVRGDALYVATAAGSLWHLDAATGAVVWRRSGFGPFYATPLFDGGRLILGDNDGVLSIVAAAGGDLVATFRADGAIQGGAVRIGEGIAFGSRDRRLHLLTLRDGGGAP